MSVNIRKQSLYVFSRPY